MPERPKPYDPLDRVELGRSVERALLAQPLSALPPADRFVGAGLYAIYYTGDFEAYSAITPPVRAAGEVPIYVGRARPKGARKGIVEGLDATTPDPVLYKRLREHARSIRRVEEHATTSGVPNLRLHDFRCRYLVADDIWVPLGEALLIGHYLPVWNVLVDGFGNHGPGGGRPDQARSPWDELHPGRAWAFKLPEPRHTADQLTELVSQRLAEASEPDLSATPDLGGEVQEALTAEAAEDAPEALPGIEEP